MVKKGKFIEFASTLKVDGDFRIGEAIYSTEMQTIIELSKKIIELELRIKVLEDAKKEA